MADRAGPKGWRILQGLYAGLSWLYVGSKEAHVGSMLAHVGFLFYCCYDVVETTRDLT